VGGNNPVENVSWFDVIVFCNRLSIREGLTPVYSMPDFDNSTDPDVWMASSSEGIIPVAYNAEWNRVKMDINLNGYRLPTEAEWEYACRAGKETAHNTGSNTIDDNTGWYKVNSSGSSHEVAQKPPNAWGLYDMHGNVDEWCWDRWSNVTTFYSTPEATEPNPEGLSSEADTFRVFRGGNWNADSMFLRSSSRQGGNPGVRGNFRGFRLVRR
jgi:formylglycine-generating enzyme required for sulfatase activity